MDYIVKKGHFNLVSSYLLGGEKEVLKVNNLVLVEKKVMNW